MEPGGLAMHRLPGLAQALWTGEGASGPRYEGGARQSGARGARGAWGRRRSTGGRPCGTRRGRRGTEGRPRAAHGRWSGTAPGRLSQPGRGLPQTRKRGTGLRGRPRRGWRSGLLEDPLEVAWRWRGRGRFGVIAAVDLHGLLTAGV